MFALFFRLLKIAKEYKLWMLLAAFVGFLTIGSSIGLMMTSAYIIAKAALHPSIMELQVGIVGVRFFGIARGIFRYAERYISHEVTFNLLAKFRVWFFNAIAPLVPSKISKYKSGDLLNRAVADVESLEHFFVRVIAPPIVAFFVLILFILLFGMYSFSYSFTIAFFYLLAGIGVPFLTFYLSKDIGPKLVELQGQLSELSIDQVQGVADLLVFGQHNKYLEKFNSINKQYTSLQRRMALIAGLQDSLIGLLMNFAVVFILVVAIPDVTSGFLDGVYLSVLALGTMAVFEAVNPLPMALQYLEKTAKAAEEIFEIEKQKPLEKAEIKNPKKPEEYSILLKSIDFAYDSSNQIYDNLSLTIPQNKITAIVGASGAGKSTLINLLLKFWKYEKGKITIGKIDLNNITPDVLNKIIAVAPQDTHLFNLSIKENLKFAKADATDEEIVNAAKKAHIHNFIESLPGKYNELIGEQGLKISGGQRQRLSIARALLKDSPIIIFDEPTSDLDSITEAKLLDTFYELAKTKTVLIITHRLVHLSNVDNIVVMHKGEIVESGNHNELINLNGFYKKLIDAQNSYVA
jgi:ATP-binding cassette subfamily C protein CydC